MVAGIEFVRREKVDWATNRRLNEVVVLRDGRVVAALPEADRLERALALDFEEARWIAAHFQEIMRREPTADESEFWRAIVEYKLQLRTLVDNVEAFDDTAH